jgi:hypothetical protein
VGAGFKLFQDDDVLLASEVMGFMMRQQVCVFADATERDATILDPQEGQFAFLRNTDTLTVYTTTWGNF